MKNGFHVLILTATAFSVALLPTSAAWSQADGGGPQGGPEGEMDATETWTIPADSRMTIQYIGSAPGMDYYPTWGHVDFGWSHTFDPTAKDVFSAELTIEAWDVEYPDEQDEVYADGQFLGVLIGSTTTFPTDSATATAMLADGQMDIWLDVDATGGGWAVRIDGSQLRVHWDWQKVPVDIKPGSCPNPLNVTGKGVLSVAVLGTEDFDVAIIDSASVQLAGVAPLRWSVEAAATLVGDGAEECECTTAGADGPADLTLKFDAQEIVAALGDVADGNVLPLDLTGRRRVEYGGLPFQGEDCVVVLSKGRPD